MRQWFVPLCLFVLMLTGFTSAQGLRPVWLVLPEDASSHPEYVQAISAAFPVRVQSQWLHAVSVETTLGASEIRARFPFVTAVLPVRTLTPASNPVRESERALRQKTLGADGLDAYGGGNHQAEMMNVKQLHALGYRGEGVKIAIMDAGFAGADTLPCFRHLWARNKVIATHDFVDDEEKVWEDDDHGLQVLSCIGAYQPGSLIGTAPFATFLLGRTETVFSESRMEEDNWVKGMEWADSLGADIIHSSLGYSTFDNSTEDYKYDSLDGKTSLITRAAQIASERGILIVSSAGNEGASTWHYVTCPCDAPGVLCVGSVDSLGRKSYFSSVGPTFDGRTKPDVVAMGSRAWVMSTDGYPVRSDGTSYSAPQVAGLAACLMQAHPARSAAEIIQAIRESGNRASDPGPQFGYGIPDALKADSLLCRLDSAAVTRNPDKWSPQHHFRITVSTESGIIGAHPYTRNYRLKEVQYLNEKGKIVSTFPARRIGENDIQFGLPETNRARQAQFVTDSGEKFRITLSHAE